MQRMKMFLRSVECGGTIHHGSIRETCGTRVILQKIMARNNYVHGIIHLLLTVLFTKMIYIKDCHVKTLNYFKATSLSSTLVMDSGLL